MKFIIFVINKDFKHAPEEEMQQIREFNQSLKDNNQYVMAEGIADPSHAKTIDNRGNILKEEKGSVFKEEEYVNGFWIIEAKDEIQAQELARKASFSCNRKVELRPVL